MHLERVFRHLKEVQSFDVHNIALAVALTLNPNSQPSALVRTYEIGRGLQYRCAGAYIKRGFGWDNKIGKLPPDIVVLPHNNGGFQVFLDPSIADPTLLTTQSVNRMLRRLT